MKGKRISNFQDSHTSVEFSCGLHMKFGMCPLELQTLVSCVPAFARSVGSWGQQIQEFARRAMKVASSVAQFEASG